TFARLHPILNERLPHLGVDFAAPVGTPVMAAGDGVVVFAGWDGGFGNCVRLRHANGYTTSYGHLSRIGVRAGQRVEQGSPVGAPTRARRSAPSACPASPPAPTSTTA